MIKHFQQWHQKKEKLHNNERKVFFHEREVWWCSLGANIGFVGEENYKQIQKAVIHLVMYNRLLVV